MSWSGDYDWNICSVGRFYKVTKPFECRKNVAKSMSNYNFCSYKKQQQIIQWISNPLLQYCPPL